MARHTLLFGSSACLSRLARLALPTAWDPALQDGRRTLRAARFKPGRPASGRGSGQSSRLDAPPLPLGLPSGLNPRPDRPFIEITDERRRYLTPAALTPNTRRNPALASRRPGRPSAEVRSCQPAFARPEEMASRWAARVGSRLYVDSDPGCITRVDRSDHWSRERDGRDRDGSRPRRQRHVRGGALPFAVRRCSRAGAGREPSWAPARRLQGRRRPWHGRPRPRGRPGNGRGDRRLQEHLPSLHRQLSAPSDSTERRLGEPPILWAQIAAAQSLRTR